MEQLIHMYNGRETALARPPPSGGLTAVDVV